MIINLNILERGLLNTILAPCAGDMLTLKIIRQLRESLSFTEEEIEEYRIRVEGGNMSWNSDAEKEFTIGKKALEIIVQKLKELNKDKQLQQPHFSLVMKFCPKLAEGEDEN